MACFVARLCSAVDKWVRSILLSKQEQVQGAPIWRTLKYLVSARWKGHPLLSVNGKLAFFWKRTRCHLEKRVWHLETSNFKPKPSKAGRLPWTMRCVPISVTVCNGGIARLVAKPDCGRVGRGHLAQRHKCIPQISKEGFQCLCGRYNRIVFKLPLVRVLLFSQKKWSQSSKHAWPTEVGCKVWWQFAFGDSYML